MAFRIRSGLKAAGLVTALGLSFAGLNALLARHKSQTKKFKKDGTFALARKASKLGPFERLPDSERRKLVSRKKTSKRG